MYHNIRSLIIIIMALQRVHRPDLVWYVAASIYWLVVSNAIHIMYDYICTEYGEILSPKCYDSASQSTVVSSFDLLVALPGRCAILQLLVLLLGFAECRNDSAWNTTSSTSYVGLGANHCYSFTSISHHCIDIKGRFVVEFDLLHKWFREFAHAFL